MDQRVKIAAAGVLLVGIVIALLFLRDPPPLTPPVPGTSEHLLLGKRAEPHAAAQQAVPQPYGRCDAGQAAPVGSQEAARPVTVLTPMDSSQPPPDLGRSYPNNSVPGNSRWGISMRQMLPEATRPEPAPQTHKIVDGDTLTTLAEHYLDSKDAAMAIFEANRDVLSSPQILPIGAELKIPSRGATGSAGTFGSRKAVAKTVAKTVAEPVAPHPVEKVPLAPIP